ncbi:hypothetical protein DPMN_104427 [Dreissena polymorpha]|uniref:Uncharacterized protein n=1 Tax=Dreissena polymorpha TaxID=45954 RepID=A0A9D4HBK4_DREPO|nr:hypothetical protein DPMN_104427 [Dreissena polymorpha]
MHILYRAQDRRYSPEHDYNTSLSTRAPTCNRQPKQVGLVWTRHRARLSVQGFPLGHARVVDVEAVRRKAG